MTDKGLLGRIEDDALDPNTRVAEALRKCVAFGGRAGSAELRDWASRELHGYPMDVEVPEYRVINAPLAIDGVAGYTLIKGQPISSTDLPDEVQGKVSETLELRPGIGELEEGASRGSGEAVKFGVVRGDLIAKMMTYEIGKPQVTSVHSVYWHVSTTALAGVVDRVRTTLVELVAELRAGSDDPDNPSPGEVGNAINVVIHKRGRVTINAAQASGSGPAQILPPAERNRPWWRTTVAIWSFVVGAAAIISAIIAWLQFR